MKTQAHLIVDIARMEKGGLRLEGASELGALELGESEFITPIGGMSYTLNVEVFGTELLVRGAVWQKMTCVCSRCADTFETEVRDAEFVYCLEINEQTDCVDLTGEVREAIILALPSYPVCSKTCKGLCMTCGKNLNGGICTCHEAGLDNRWGALDGLS